MFDAILWGRADVRRLLASRFDLDLHLLDCASLSCRQALWEHRVSAQ
jgi:hypothetical protein